VAEDIRKNVHITNFTPWQNLSGSSSMADPAGQKSGAGPDPWTSWRSTPV